MTNNGVEIPVDHLLFRRVQDGIERDGSSRYYSLGVCEEQRTVRIEATDLATRADASDLDFPGESGPACPARVRTLSGRAVTHSRSGHRSIARLINKCKKPDKKEFLKVARLTAVGFLAVGFLGFFVKLIFLPINQIVVSSS